MTVDVGRQGLELLLAAALGVGLGLLYDMGRALRRQRIGWTAPADLLFALVFFLVLWLTGIYAGGLRLFHCLGIGLGACVYFLTLSPHTVRIFRRFFRSLGCIVRKIRARGAKGANILQKHAKKLFPYRRKWSTILETSRPWKRRREPRT